MAALLVQGVASGFFPGSNRGLNLPVSAVSFIAWSYRGLLENEFLYRSPHLWGCPGANILAVRVCYQPTAGLLSIHSVLFTLLYIHHGLITRLGFYFHG